MSTVEEFIIAGKPTDVRSLHDLLASDPEVAIIEVGADRLLVAMDTVRKDALATAFGSRFLIEDNFPVFPPDAPRPE